MTGRLEACIDLAKKIGLKNKIVLDVGCSFAWFCKVAIEEKANKVYGIEPDPAKIALARQEAPKAIISQGEAGFLNFPKNKFDLVTLFDVIEHVPANSESQVFSEIYKVLKPKGHLLISTPFDYWLSNIFDPAWYFGHRHYSKDKLTKLLKQAGFKVTYASVRGGFWEVFAMWVLYVSKWVFRMDMPFEEWFDKKRRVEYQNPGRVGIFVIAQKLI